MKCHEVKKHIYLYDELTDEERALVIRHIEGCSACRESFKFFQDQQLLVKEAASERPVLNDPMQMTSRIMSSIEKKKVKKYAGVDSIMSYFDWGLVRYGMAALSVMLIVFFLTEQNVQGAEGGMSTDTNKAKRSTSGWTFSMTSLQEIVNRGKVVRNESPESIYDCIKQWQSGDDKALCRECKNKYYKLYKRYENI